MSVNRGVAEYVVKVELSGSSSQFLTRLAMAHLTSGVVSGAQLSVTLTKEMTAQNNWNMSQMKPIEVGLPDLPQDVPGDEVSIPRTEAVVTMGDWRVLVMKSRVDSFNQEELVAAMTGLRAQGCRCIALDLKANRFLSFQAIRFCVDTARELAAEGGSFALIGPSEKTRRHFQIYGSLSDIQVLRSVRDLATSSN